MRPQSTRKETERKLGAHSSCGAGEARHIGTWRRLEVQEDGEGSESESESESEEGDKQAQGGQRGRGERRTRTRTTTTTTREATHHAG